MQGIRSALLWYGALDALYMRLVRPRVRKDLGVRVHAGRGVIIIYDPETPSDDEF